MNKEVDTKQKILNIALDLFSQKGFESTGVQLLCEKSEITKPTLYYYFGSKEGLIREILLGYYKKLNALLLSQSVYVPNPENYDEDVYPVLMRVVKAYFDFAKNNQKFYQMVLSSLFAPKTSLTYKMIFEFHKTQYEIVEHMFFEFSKVHHNMKRREKLFAHTFISIINAYIGLWYNEGGELFSNSANELVRQFMHGIFS